VPAQEPLLVSVLKFRVRFGQAVTDQVGVQVRLVLQMEVTVPVSVTVALDFVELEEHLLAPRLFTQEGAGLLFLSQFDSDAQQADRLAGIEPNFVPRRISLTLK